MDWMTFISKAIESLAWPTVTLILGLVFRQKILGLIPNLRKFKAGPLEAEFELATKDVLASATQAAALGRSPAHSGTEPTASIHNTDLVERLREARGDPAGMILGGWARVDRELFSLGLQLQVLGDHKASSAKIYEAVVGTEVLPSGTIKLVQELRSLRNQVAHAKVAPTVDAAQDYLLAVDRVVELIHNYRKNLPRYVPTTE